MKRSYIIVFCAVLSVLFCNPLVTYSQELSCPRVFVFTDVNNEPDDEESLVRFFVYSNEYDVEGLLANTSCWLKRDTREDLSSVGTSDPDGDDLTVEWWIYPEAGTTKGAVLHKENANTVTVDLSGITKSSTIHVIFQVNDNPNLYAYRRVVIMV